MITFFTDPHLGRNAASHTTPASRKQLDLCLFETAKTAATLFDEPTICCGDLFHHCTNTEAVIEQGIVVARNCDVLMEGNHDLPNRKGLTPSIGLLPYSLSDTMIAPCLIDEARVYGHNIDGVEVVFVPHHSSQELFDQAIAKACLMSGEIICLHCNYDSPFAEGFNASLNLSPTQAETLLTCYDYIVLGHEHNTRWELDGRLLTLGNTHPTSFSDISNKYAWRYHQAEGKWHKVLLWNKDYHYAERSLDEVLESVDGLDLPPNIQFLEITGELQNTHQAHLLSQRMTELWEVYGGSLLMLRNNTTVAALETDSDGLKKTVSADNLVGHISKMVEGTELETLFKSYVDEVTQ